MQTDSLATRLDALGAARVAVFGDFCLDGYWLIHDDGNDAEVSIETGLPVRRVREQRYSPGGAGNVAANLIDLGIANVRAIGLVGNDLFGASLVRLLGDRGVDTAGMLTAPDWQTMVYAKPCTGDDEHNRLDFGAFNTIDADAIDRLAAALDVAAEASDIVILNQQVAAGVSTHAMIDRLNEVIARHHRCRFIVDSRHRPGAYRGAMLKLNDAEAARLCDTGAPADGDVDDATVWRLARTLHERAGRGVFITRGQRGVTLADDHMLVDLPAVPVRGPIDTVGAGDTVIAALAGVLGSGGSPIDAARLAMLAASVTVTKLQTTGTATPAEITARAAEHAHASVLEPAYQPDIADDPDAATYLPDTRIETVRPLPSDLRIDAAVFDHDGTIVTLRRGWERVMRDVMLDAVLGDTPRDTLDPDTLADITRDVEALIDRTTGIQTLVQMRELLPMIRQRGYVAKADMLDEHGYKARYAKRIRDVVKQRVEAMQRGEVERDAVMIRGVEPLLNALQQRGVTLYLTSGSDQPDIRADAELLGLTDTFADIRGAVGNVNVEAKRVVLDRLIDELGDGRRVVVFGDGPVEIREGVARGAATVGVASEEDQPGELQLSKRRRLVRAGAHLIVPDYTELDALLSALHLD